MAAVTPEQEIERMARAICAAFGEDPDHVVWWQNPHTVGGGPSAAEQVPFWNCYKNRAMIIRAAVMAMEHKSLP